MYTNEELLRPVSESKPCGDDVSFDPCMDLIAAARRHDDPTLDQGEWATPLHSADWPTVANHCGELLRARSKDLRLAVWLAEARAHTHQLRGLGDGFLLLAGLCERYWDQVHPLPEGGDQELRSGNLAWLLGRTPALVAASPQQGDAAAALRDAQHCLQALQALQAAVDARLGAEGPSFGAAREAVARALELAAIDAPAGIGGPVAVQAGRGSATALAIVEPGAAPRMPQSREHALAQLRLVADFFRRTEPHSPVAYLADKAASWGELPLHAWLRAVVKDPAQLAQLDELLGAPSQA
ncbi:MAG: tssA [Pseudoduganella sp.]|jgi:type VI secretion system protein ImpA|nr:tssA [Pseudoduganella sp.]